MRIKFEEWVNNHSHFNERSQAGFQLKMLLENVLPIAKECDELAEMHVRSTHSSKSIVLPVVELGLPKIGLKIFARDNFYNTAFTVESENPIIGFNESNISFEHLNDCYFEGFARGNIPLYGSCEENNKKFSGFSGIELDYLLRRIIDTLV